MEEKGTGVPRALHSSYSMDSLGLLLTPSPSPSLRIVRLSRYAA